MFGVYVIHIATFLWILNIITTRISLKNWLVIKYSLLICLVLLCSIPFFESHYTLINLVYAFFDTPSIFCIFIALAFIVLTILRDFTLPQDFFWHIHLLKPISIVFYCLCVLLLYLGTLNIIPHLDIYHYQPLWQNIFLLCVLIIMIYIDTMIGIFFALSCLYMLLWGDKNLAQILFCPYMWLYSIGYTLWCLLRFLKNANEI